MNMSNYLIHKKIESQFRKRMISESYIGFKINLYKDFEIEALANAMQSLGFYNSISKKCQGPIECLMVGDSYFMTHLNQSTTKLITPEAQKDGLNLMVNLVKEASKSMSNLFINDEQSPYLVADMPDGSIDTPDDALRAAERMLEAGADVIKIEIPTEDVLPILNVLCQHNFPVMAHIGYAPQRNGIKRYGGNYDEALSLFELAKKVRDHDAVSIVLEMVSEIVNKVLSKPGSNGLPIYSIFSGYAVGGGQSLNIWDSVFMKEPASKFFPPTASYKREEYPGVYTYETIAIKIKELIKLTLEREFPFSPTSPFSFHEEEKLLSLDPWVSSYE